MDTYLEHNSDAPWNKIEVDAEIVESELDVAIQLNHIITQRLSYKILQLIKLAEIEQSYKTFGVLTFDEQQEKNEILNQYLNN